MPRNQESSSSSSHPAEEGLDSGIRATGPLPAIPEGSEISSGLLGSLMGEMESIQEVIHHQEGQMSDLMGLLRSMEEEMKKIQIYRHNDRIERVNDRGDQVLHSKFEWATWS